MSIKIGDTLPDVDLHEGTPGNSVNIRTLFEGKKGVLFAVPGAFTPGCSKTHLPGYVQDAAAFRAKGVEVIACVAVNDAFVMSAWGKAHDVGDAIHMLADPAARFTREIGLDVESAGLGGTRSKRYSMVIEDGVVTALNVEPDGFGLSCSLAPPLLAQL